VQITPAVEGWLDVDLSGYSLMATGDFLVGYLQAQADAYPWIGFDTSSPGDRSCSAPGWSHVLPAGSNVMIRVIVGPG